MLSKKQISGKKRVIEYEPKETLPPVVISTPLINKLLSRGKFPELIGLYIFYYKTGRRQKTNQPWAKNSFVAKGLGWSITTVKKYKKILIDIGLIQNISSRKRNGTFGKWYIKVNYMWTQKAIEKLQNQLFEEYPLV